MEFRKLNLYLFGGEATGETSAPVPAPAAEGSKAVVSTPVVYGKQETPTVQVPVAEVTQKPSFKELIDGDYKEDFTKFFNEKFNERHKDHKALETKVNTYEGVLQIVAEKYGITELDAQKVLKAIEEDETYYERDALDRGMTVQQVKEFKRVEREKNQLLKEKTEREKTDKAAQIQAQWHTEEETLKTVYPMFDFASEVQNPKFVGLITNHIDLRTAYEVVHREELMTGAIHKTAQVIDKAIRQDIKARGSRPLEEGASGSPAAIIKDNPKTWTPSDFAEVRKRVARGEIIKF